MSEHYVLRWTKDNLPFWQEIDTDKMIEINNVASALNERDALKVYCDKLADGLPDGMLPKDIELLHKANQNFAEENHTLKQEIERLREGVQYIVDGEEYYKGLESSNAYDGTIEAVCDELRILLEGSKV